MKARIALVGSGDIAGQYVDTLRMDPALDVVSVFSRRPEPAAAFAAKYNLKAHASLESLLADGSVNLVLNLAPNNAHPAITEACLRAGKHVYSEKPLATDYDEAARLAALAKQLKLRLACAPCAFLGDAQQAAMQRIHQGALGTLRLIYAEINHSRIESWHPAPQSFYDAGPMFDVGVYPLSLLCATLGPVEEVQATGAILLKERKTKDGQTVTVNSPDYLTAMLKFKSGPLARLTVNYYVDWYKKQKGIEFHGDQGSLFIADHGNFNSELLEAGFEKEYAPLPAHDKAYAGLDWSRGVRDLAQAIEQDRPHRCSAEMAAHVVEVVEACYRSIDSKGPVRTQSTFSAPEPMPTA
jgi:predicted dehydrogenase